MSGLVEKARIFATACHEGQYRKNSGDPYITHPTAVAAMVASIGGSIEEICAAYLHDTVEDTPATLTEIQDIFGLRIAAIVDGLTDKKYTGDRATRKERIRRDLALKGRSVKTVKIADIIHNLSDIHEAHSVFADIYIAERILLLAVLTEGDSRLWLRAMSAVSEYVRGR